MDEDFLQQLQAAFRIEADEHLQALSAGLLDMERVLVASTRDSEAVSSGAVGGQTAKLTETIFREAHSLKGAARAVNFDDVERICQALEDVFSDWKNGKLPTETQGRNLFDPLHAGLDMMQAILSESLVSQKSRPIAQILAIVDGIQATKNAPIQKPTAKVAEPISPFPKADVPEESNGSLPHHTLNTAPQTTPMAVANAIAFVVETPRENGTQNPGGTPPSAAAETIRISTDKLDALLLQTEELVALKMTAQQRLLELRELETGLKMWRKEENKVVEEMRALPQRPEMARGLEILRQQQNYLRALETKISSLAKTSERDRHTVNGLVDNLLEDTKKLLMQPFSTMLAIFPKLVRDVAQQLGKEVDFQIHGGEVEIDKRILEEMKAPLTHLLRNAVDHGLEQPEARLRNGKTARGRLRIEIVQIGGRVHIEISDDGNGITTEGVKAAAVKNGALTPAEAARINDEDALQLIFRSSVSTSPIVTELSGRGLGMAIVREKVENLGGDITLESHSGKGTTFRISLPLTLATFRGLLVQEAGQLFVIPTLGIERVVRVRREDIKTVEGQPTISVRGEVIALRTLRSALGISGDARAKPQRDFLTIVVLGSIGERIAFDVEEILEEQEVLLKSFEKPLLRVRHFAGATVLGSGRLAPVLLIADLLQTARSTAAEQRMLSTNRVQSEAQTLYKILVADDSITSRMLLKNILEAAGYQVQTAVDGQDAITVLRAGKFDLLVSDVDMPRLNGFGLTEQVRSDARLSEMPVVLVTGRGTREDRERGIDVGANAYIVKSSFDQNNLLEVIERLL